MHGGLNEEATPLFKAINLDQPDVVDVLLQASANPHAWGFQGEVCPMIRLPDRMLYFDAISPLR